MATPHPPTQAQREQAFAQVRCSDWPASLVELELDASPLATARIGIVLGAARHLANGGHLDRPDLTGPITRGPHQAAAHPTPARRHGDAGNDRKRAAAGDRDDE